MVRKRRRKKKNKSLSMNSFHMTVGAFPSGSLSLEGDLRLLKAALLYSDKVTLCSVTSSLLIDLISLGELDSAGILDYMEYLVKSNGMIDYGIKPTDETLELINDLRERFRGNVRTKKEFRPALELVEGQILNSWEPLRSKIEEMASEAGVEGLNSAVQSGLVELKVLGVEEYDKDSLGDIGESLDPLAAEYVVFLMNSISDINTYPLFDDQSGDLIKASVDEGIISVSESATSRGKHSILAGKLLEKLPLFDYASIDEILEIRRELERPLVRFRKSVIEFSESLRNAAWDDDFPFEVDRIFQRDIAPSILDIEDQIRSNRSLLALLEKGMRKPAAKGGIITVAVSQFSSLPEIAAIATYGGAALAAGSVILSMIKDYKVENKKIEQNQLYFYYRAGNLLQSL